MLLATKKRHWTRPAVVWTQRPSVVPWTSTDDVVPTTVAAILAETVASPSVAPQPHKECATESLQVPKRRRRGCCPLKIHFFLTVHGGALLQFAAGAAAGLRGPGQVLHRHGGHVGAGRRHSLPTEHGSGHRQTAQHLLGLLVFNITGPKFHF